MQNALISPTELIYNYATPPVVIGSRIAQISADRFPVAKPLFWVVCDDAVTPEQYYYDGTNCVLKPTPPPQEYALISPNDKIYDNSYTPPLTLGFRIVAVSTVQATQPAPLYWVACPNYVTPNGYYYTGSGFATLPAGA
jgi:hypothetical protein